MRGRRILREIGIFTAFLVLAVVLTWPFAKNIHTVVPDMGDPLLNTFIIDWGLHSFTHNPLGLFDAPFYQPAIYTLAYSENLTAVALLMLPFHLLGAAPLTVYNIAFLLGFALAGYGASVLARVCGRSLFASMVAGVFFAFCPFKFDHLAHIQIIWSGWLPLMFAALFVYWRGPTAGRAALLGAAFVMNGLTNIHWLLFGSFTLAATIVLLSIIEWPDWKKLAGVVAALVIGSAILLPFLIPYRVVSKAYSMQRSPDEVMFYSATWQDWLFASPRSLLYGQIPNGMETHGERFLFPGVVPLFLALAALFMVAPKPGRTVVIAPRPVNRGLVRLLDALIVIFAVATYVGAASADFKIRLFHHTLVSIDNAALPAFYLLIAVVLRLALRMPRAFGAPARTLSEWLNESRFTAEEWGGLMWIAIGVIGSLGLHGLLHEFLYRHVEAYRSMRVPARWAIIAYLGLVIWSSLGVDLLLRARRGFRWSAAAAAIAVFMLLDVSARVRWQQMVVEPPKVYQWLRTAPLNGYVLELPTTGFSVEFLYLLNNTYHHRPIMNGTSGFEPPVHAALREMTERGEINDVFLNELEQHHCELVVVHVDWLGRQRDPTIRWLIDELKSGRLVFVRRFDHDIEGDYVFALTHNAPDWQRFRGPQTRDAAGLTPDEEALRFLQGQSTYNSSTFFSLDSPRWEEVHHGPLRVSGWALSPNGISHVRIRLSGGAKVYEAKFTDRVDVQKRWPWYPKTIHAGFMTVLEKRPKGFPRETNLQLEVVDGAGNVTRWFDIPVTWD